MEKQLFALILITLLAGVSLAMVSVSFDPFEAPDRIKLLFFASLFSFMWGISTVAFFILNLATRDRWQDSFRRGLFLALLFIALVLFRRHDIFSWYIGAIFGGIFIALEVWIYKKMNRITSVDSQNLE